MLLCGRGTWMKIELFTLLLKPLFQESEMLSLSALSLYGQATPYGKFHKDIIVT